MWKLALAFVIFAAAALWLLSKGGDVDMGGEKHEINVPHTPEAPASAVAPAKPASAQ